MDRKIDDWGGNIIAFLIVIAVNSLANIIPIGGQTTGEISAKYPSLFTPAGYTFSIWGVIYLCLFAFIIFQALPTQRNNDVIASIRKMFVLNCLANATWIFVWHFDFIFLSLLVMVVILVTLVQIYRLIRITDADATVTLSQRCFVNLPFSLYIGWITVAIVANISVVQTGYGWDSFGISAIYWTLIKLAVTGAIGAMVVLLRKDIIFGLVLTWAGFGIAVKQIAVPAVSGAATTIAILILLLILIEVGRNLLQSKIA